MKELWNTDDTDCPSKKATLKENNKRFMAQIKRESPGWISIFLPYSWFNLFKALLQGTSQFQAHNQNIIKKELQVRFSSKIVGISKRLDVTLLMYS